MSESAWFDPRLTVFIIWGIFVFLFICIPSKRLVQSLLYKCGCNCCGYEESEILPTNISGSQSGTQYEHLSTARKQEIDSLRASHLTYRLHPFSLTLEKKHMLRHTSDTEDPQSQTRETVVNDNNTTTIPPPPQDRTTPPTFENLNNEDIDIEMGDARGMDPPECDDTAPCRSGEEQSEENKEEEKEAEGIEKEEGQYSHISIPQPGYNFDCEDVVKLALESNENEKDTPTPVDTPPPKKRFRFFSRAKEKEDNTAQEVELKEEPETAADTPITKVELAEEEKEKRRRSCLANCAVCLGEYEIADRITWSSNPSCNHCFHEDCLVSWFVTLGKTKSRHQRFVREPTEAQLLNYDLECPCCRQEFVCRRHAQLPEVIEV